VKEVVSLICSDLQGETQKATTFIIRGIGVVVVKVKVRRSIGGGLGSKPKKWELVVEDTQILGWF